MKGARTRQTRSSASPAQAPGDSLITLFSVRFRHSYYNASDDRCPDLGVEPTPDCAALMRRLGAIFKDQGVGFSVLIPQSRIGAMLQAIEGAYCDQPEGQGFWTRLSFQLLLKNPQFLSLTALPIDAVPTEVNLFASNLETTPGKHALALGPKAAVEPQALLPITGPALTVPPGAKGLVSVRDISGALVCSADASSGAQLSLAGQPFGYYTISAGSRRRAAAPRAVLYMPAARRTLGLLDLFLSQPTPQTGVPDAFPVPAPGSNDGAGPQTVQLALNFKARSTYLNYFVVSQNPGGAFSDTLAVTGAGAKFRQTKAQLCDGQPAVLFTADTPLPLGQRSTHSFTLSGQRRGSSGSLDDIRIDRLPNAPSSPVWPAASGDALTGRSEIYVYV